jgi:hypothetical protein
MVTEKEFDQAVDSLIEESTPVSSMFPDLSSLY